MPNTIGISPKLAVPVIAALTALLTSWVATGAFDGGEVRGLIATIALAVVSYLAPAGYTAMLDDPPEQDAIDLPDEHPDAV